MKLSSPFFIHSNLCAAIEISPSFVLFWNSEKKIFVIEYKVNESSEWEEHEITDFRFPACRIAGDTNESVLQDGFASILSFLSACIEAREYNFHRYGSCNVGSENANLFPPHIGEFAEWHKSEIEMLYLQVIENKGLIEQ